MQRWPSTSGLSAHEEEVGVGAVYYPGSIGMHHRPLDKRAVRQAPKLPPGLSLQQLCLHELGDYSQFTFAKRDAAAIFRTLERMYNSDLGGSTCEATKALYSRVRDRLCVGMVAHKNTVEFKAAEEERTRGSARDDAEAVRLRCEAEVVQEAWEEADACLFERKRRREAARLEVRLDT